MRTALASDDGGPDRSVVIRRQDGPLGLGSVATIPFIDDVIDAALRLVVILAEATVAPADGVSVSLTRHSRLSTVAASNETIIQMDHDQYATRQGPCVSAATEGTPFHSPSLSAETRWGDFVPRAISGGIHSILSTPLMVASRPVGALNMYSSTDSAFGAADLDLATLFAAQASSLLDAGFDVADADVSRRLQGALLVRESIAQAQGVVMERTGVSAEDAAAALMSSAREAGSSVRARALVVLASTARDAVPDPEATP